LREQREIIYEQRMQIIESESNVREIVEGMIETTIARTVDTNTAEEEVENWNLQAIIDYVNSRILNEGDLTIDDINNQEPEEIKSIILKKIFERYDEKEEELPEEQIREFEKVILLRIVDTKWMDHNDQMVQLRQGIHLRAYAQDDQLREYQMEGFAMIEAMIENIEEEVARYIMKANIRENLQREEVVKNTQAVSGGQDKKKKKRRPYVRKHNIGRNDPCPCGSGKKYKNCHGK